MSQNSNKKSIGAIVDFVFGTDDLSNDEIEEELRKSGIDVDVAVPKILMNINKKVYGKTWTDMAFDNKAKMSSIAKDVSQKFVDGKDSLLEMIREMLSSEQIQMQHRDYKDLTEDDLISLLEDVEFLRKLDESKRES